MYVIPDSNVIIADIWCKKRSTEVFFNCIQKSLADLVFLEPVIIEVEAESIRMIDDTISKLRKTHELAKQHQFSGVPEMDWKNIRDRTIVKWIWSTNSWFLANNSPLKKILDKFDYHSLLMHEHWKKTVPVRASEYSDFGLEPTRVSLFPSLTEEAFRRAATRKAPSTTGRMRDSIIWLTMLNHARMISELRDRKELVRTVFISGDKKAFVSSDDTTLKSELQEESIKNGCSIEYFKSVDEFNAKYATKWEYITVPWISERIDKGKLMNVVNKTLDIIPLDLFIVADECSNAETIRLSEVLSFDIIKIDYVQAMELSKAEAYTRIGITLNRVRASAIITNSELKESVEILLHSKGDIYLDVSGSIVDGELSIADLEMAF